MNKWLELFKSNDYLGIKKYLRDGGDIHETNEAGEGVLACALRARCDMDTLLLLIENGANIDATDDEGVSVLDIAITYDNLEMVRYLVASGRDVNTTYRRSGFTPLMAAACYGRVEIAEYLLQQGADVTMADRKGFTAVDFARKMNKRSILELLEFDPQAPQNKNYAR